jgi:hypothetical protein
MAVNCLRRYSIGGGGSGGGGIGGTPSRSTCRIVVGGASFLSLSVGWDMVAASNCRDRDNRGECGRCGLLSLAPSGDERC